MYLTTCVEIDDVLFLTDPTLNCRHVLAALESVEDSDDVGELLGVPDTMMEELEGKSTNDSQYRKSLVKYYLEYEPFASWDHLGALFLVNDESTAFQRVKGYIKPERGECMWLFPVLSDIKLH